MWDDDFPFLVEEWSERGGVDRIHAKCARLTSGSEHSTLPPQAFQAGI
jgi:hypothetical protein